MKLHALRGIIGLGIALLLGISAMASASQSTGDVPDSRGSRPPSSFHIADVVIVLESPRHSTECPSRTITLRGAGASSCVCAEREEAGAGVLGTSSFTLPTADIELLLREFYRLGFFDLRESHLGSVDVQVDSEGHVRVFDLVVAPYEPADRSRLSIRIGAYSKSVVAPRRHHGSPAAFVELFEQVERIAAGHCQEAYERE